MLTAPKDGWSDIKIGNWSDRCSYLSDVPFDLLRAVYFVLRTGEPCQVSFNAEGWEYDVLFDVKKASVICEDKDIHKTFNISIKDISVDLVSDIRRDIQAWAEWDCDEPDEKLIKERLGDLYSYCSRISRLVDMT